MSTVRNLIGNAIITAELRAECAEEPAPLFHDPYARLFLNSETKSLAEMVTTFFAPARDIVKLRTRYFDEALKRQLALGCRQVVILGSGLDTRAIRFNMERVAYFEVDDPETLQLKAETLRYNDIHAPVRYVRGDYLQNDLIAMLRGYDFNLNYPTHILWEGNTTYLSEPEVKKVLHLLHDQIGEFSISFDYMSDKVIQKATGYPALDHYMEEFAKLGAPWRSGFASIEPLSRELGMKVTENISAEDLCKRYCPNELVSSPLLHFYFVCTLASVRRREENGEPKTAKAHAR